MADYVPSSTGQGQGSAQVLEGKFTPINMDETVKAIDNYSNRIVKEKQLDKKKEYEKQVAAQKKRQEGIDKINDLANSNTGVAAFDNANKVIMDDFNERMRNGIESFDDIYNNTMSNFNITAAQRLNAENAAKVVIENQGQSYSYIKSEDGEGGEWTINSTPGLDKVQDQYFGLGEEEFNKAVKNGEFGSIVNGVFANTSNNPDFAFNDENFTMLKLYKDSKEALETEQSIEKTGEGGGQNIYTTTEVSANRKILYDTLFNNQQLREQELSRFAISNGVSRNLSPENEKIFDEKYKKEVRDIVYGDVKRTTSIKNKPREGKDKEVKPYFSMEAILKSDKNATPSEISINKIDNNTKNIGSDVIVFAPQGKGGKTATIDIEIDGETQPKEVKLLKYIRQYDGRPSVEVSYTDLLDEPVNVIIPYTEETEAILKNAFPGNQLDRDNLDRYLNSRKKTTSEIIQEQSQVGNNDKKNILKQDTSKGTLETTEESR